MVVVKLPQPPPSASVRGSVLTLAVITFISFTSLSLKSLHSPSLHYSSSSPCHTSSPNSRNVQPSLPEVFDNGDDGDDDDVSGSRKVFRLNYEEMVKRFKVYIYSDGDRNTYYQTPSKLIGKYANEGYFFKNKRESNFVTDDPYRADLFFIPISCYKMRAKVRYVVCEHDHHRPELRTEISKYSYWNRTLGADHFFVTCHDVGVRATTGLAELVKNSIRVVCSPSYHIGFIPHKDVALPQVQHFALPAGGNDIENRTRLGFGAGKRDSKIRVIPARGWGNDTELDISNNRIGRLEYENRFWRTKFCICPSGFQVNRPRISAAIHYIWSCMNSGCAIM